MAKASPSKTGKSWRWSCVTLAVVALLVAPPSPAEAAINFYRLGKRISYTQTDDSQPTTPVAMDGGVDMFADNPSNLTSARVFSTSPTVLSPASPFILTEFSPGYWNSSQFYSSLEEMDTNLPPGDIFGYLIEGGDFGARLALLTIPATNLFAPDVPYFTGSSFSELNSLDTTAPYTLNWNGYTPLDGTTEAPIFFSIYRVSDGQFMIGTTVSNTDTSFEIPADTLAPETEYRAGLAYSSRVNSFDAGFVDGDASITFDLNTNLTFTTAPVGELSRSGVPEPASTILALGGLLAMVALRRKRPARRVCPLLVVTLVMTYSSAAEANIDFYRLGKRFTYTQTDDSQPTTPVAIDGGVDLFTGSPSDLTSARAFSTIPTAPGPVFEFILTEFSPGYWNSSRFYDSLEEMDMELPPGDTFGYLIEGGDLGSQLALLPTPATNLFTPDVPYFTGSSFSELNSLDTTAPYTLNWNGYTPVDGTTEAPIFFSIYRVSDGQFMIGTTVSNTVTSIEIPANTLAPETEYRAGLAYSSRVNTFDAGFVDGDASITFDLATNLDFTTAPFLAGDYNRDERRGAADYTVWRNTLDQTGLTPFSGADGDGDGSILAADYDVWKANYGEMGAGAGAGATSLASAVPEPAGLALAICGLIATIFAHRATFQVHRI